MTATELRPISNCKLQISFLGDFRIQYGEHAVSDMDNRAHQLWNLLAYLIIFRGRAISQEELIEALWPDNSSDNPSNALKNLAYRTRSALAAGGIPNAKELIVCRRGVYSWNNQIDCEVDVEEFERLLREASDLSTPVPTRIEKYMDALALYRGDFLPKSAFENWVIPLISYFRGLYTKGVTDAVALLWQCRRYEEIVELCQHAIVIDQFDESVHSALIKAYIALGHQQKALSHYEYVTNLFYRELGVRSSDNLRNLYREIIKTVNHVEHDLEIVKEDLREASLAQGAFYCEYEIFKNIYRLEARSISRSGQAIFIAMLTVADSSGQVPQPPVLGPAMERLLEAVRSSLRRSDVVSRFSASQYVLMLLSTNFENAQLILDRIIKRFKLDNRRMSVQVSPALHSLDPVL